jgi:hypothetical protein
MSTAQHVIFTCSNCASDGTDWLGIVTLVVAGIAATVGLVALLWTKSDRQQLREQQAAFMAEHNEYMKQLRARAHFKITLTVINASRPRDDDPLGIMSAVGLTMWSRFEIGVANSGERTAGPTVVNVLVPANLSEFFWSDATGRKLVDADAPVATSEPLRIDDRDFGAQWISVELPRVSTRTPRLVWFTCSIASNVNQMPIRIKVEADELPEDGSEVVVDAVFRVYDEANPERLRGTTPGEQPAY